MLHQDSINITFDSFTLWNWHNIRHVLFTSWSAS